MPKRKAQHLAAKSRKRSKKYCLPPPEVVPFAFGFKPPARRHCERAIGDITAPEFIATDAFTPVPQPVSDLDWLAQYREDGQSFAQWTHTCQWLRNTNILSRYTGQFNPKGASIPERYPDGKIYLLPLGSFTDVGLDVDALAEYTRLFYGIPVGVLDPIPVVYKSGKVIAKMSRTFSKQTREATNAADSDANQTSEDIELTTRHEPETDHHQVRVDTGLMDLQDLMPADGILMVIITLLDLYQAAPDLFVAGIGCARSKMGVFSFFRYDPALDFSEENWFEYNLDAKCGAERSCLLLQRSSKLLVHEIGHIFGIGHCVYFSCVMNGSGNLAEDYRQPQHLCPVDLKKVSQLCGVDVILRYAQLEKFYDRHNMKAEANWVRQRVRDIKRRRDNAAITEN